MSDIIQPSAEQMIALKEQLANIPNLRRSIEVAKTAGINVAAQEASLNETEAQLKQLIAAYDSLLSRPPRRVTR